MVELPRPDTFEVEGPREVVFVAGPTEHHLRVADEIKPKEPQRTGGKFRMVMLSGALLAGVIIAAQTSYERLVVNRYFQETDNAFVKADFTAIAPKVSGYIKHILVNDNATVKAGQLLARIDDRDFQIALSQAMADLEASKAAIDNVDAQIVLQRSLVDQSEAALNASRAAFGFAQAEAERSQKLIVNGAATQSRVEQSSSVRDQAEAAVKRDEATVVATRNRIPVLATQRSQAEAQRHRVEAQVAQAELNLSYTKIVAPVDGTVGARSLRIGQLVNAGTQLMVLVPLNATYVVANFKETQLSDIRPGQPVRLHIDSFPAIEINGRVESISPGSGSEFSLLPTDNATGNFTKIVQRVPVKIAIEEHSLVGRLRSGMSVVSRIDTAEGRNPENGIWPLSNWWR